MVMAVTTTRFGTRTSTSLRKASLASALETGLVCSDGGGGLLFIRER